MSNTVKDEISFNYISLTTEETNTVQVVQPLTSVVEVLTGPMGPQGNIGPSIFTHVSGNLYTTTNDLILSSSVSISGSLTVNNFIVLTNHNFIDKEQPSGSIDGFNSVFTLQYLPVLGSEHLFLNGMFLSQGEDYTISGSSITFFDAPDSEPISSIRCSYRTM